ncbi:MAG TPA: efflux RND transporter periplasmic adaptor subunit [Verrucomicrobiae bacterium]|jgi:macrolide-specific efflux system membrane fusion protein|nr:efflux RND transporter periplasmic adaptor subunit [Verrucomicrobiae bacterium]
MRTPKLPAFGELRKKRTFISLAAIFILLAGGWYWRSRSAEDAGNAALRPVAVTSGTIEDVVTAQGKLEPNQYVDVGTQVSGQLKKIYVQIGDSVTKGQLVAEIDPRVYESQVEANEAHIASLKAQLEQQKAAAVLAHQNLQRNQNLINANAVSQQALQETQSQAAVADAQVQSIVAQIQETESNLKGIKTNLGFTKIYAPMSGTVTTMPAREGQTLNANQTAPVVMQVANLDLMTVRAQVAEADVPRLKEGMAAYFTTLGNNERRWQGKVRQIQPAPEVVNEVVLYDVLIDVKNQGRLLMTGSTTQVFFILGKADNATIIPAEALTRRAPEADNEKGKAYRVRVQSENSREERLIHVGMTTRAQAQVIDGLNPGERILLRRQEGTATASAQTGQRRNPGFTPGPRL